MTAGLTCIELSHKTAPFAVREMVTVDREGLAARLDGWKCAAWECVGLRTCGRCEVYVVSENADADWPGRFADLVELPHRVLRPHVRELRDETAAEHLLRVAAGLESLVLGESQILGQVREAYSTGDASGAAGPILSALFRAAIHTGRRVRSETGIAGAARSYAQLALDVVPEALEGRKRILIVGSGTLAFEVTEKLANLGHQLTIISRHEARGRRLAQQFGARPARFEHIQEVLAATDIVLACTSSSRFVISAEMLSKVGGPLAMIDFGMPRNIDPGVCTDLRVRLVCLEQLVDGRDLCAEVIEAAEAIVQEELQRFTRWLRARREARRTGWLPSANGERSPRSTRRAKRIGYESTVRLFEGEAA